MRDFLVLIGVVVCIPMLVLMALEIKERNAAAVLCPPDSFVVADINKKYHCVKVLDATRS